MPQNIDGKAISAQIKEELKEKVADLKISRGISICLAVIQVGSDPASSVYVGNKKKACAYIGIDSRSYELPEETTQEELLQLIDKLNNEEEVNGILVQLPLPRHIDENKVISAISVDKDVDGFHPLNVARLWLKQPCVLPCTPKGIIKLLKSAEIEISGKEAVVIGRSLVVGKPAAMMLMGKNATVTVCHTRTQDVPAVAREADILISAAGVLGSLTKEYVRPGQIVVDVSINWDEAKGGIAGDAKYEEVEPIVEAITPVPGGVGTVTTSLSIGHVVEAAKRTLG